MNLKFLLSLFMPVLLAACSSWSNTNLANVDTANLNQLEDVHYKTPTGSSATQVKSHSLRARFLKETALALGAQGGLAWASERLNVWMDTNKKYLDTIFNFNGMMLSHGVIPPVLEEGDFTLNLNDPNTIRVSDRTYKIVKQARFATTPPNWREYLYLTYARPQLPDRSLLPRDLEERRAWRCGIRMGWEKGIAQSYNIFQQNLARLKRDYRGMILYRKLLQEKMISPPFVARTELGVTGDGTDLRINDQVLRIVELPQLQTNSRNWKAIVVPR